MARIDDETIQKVSEFWDGANETRWTSKLTKFLKLLAAEKRFPVKGWTRSVIRSRGSKIGWWHNPFIVSQINKRICGRAIEGRSQGVVAWLKDTYGHFFPLERGISVGCGDGSKEILLVQEGIVTKFDLYELSEKAIEKGRAQARQLGLADRMNFRRGIATEDIRQPDSYDFVTWNDALHHMPDVNEALAWSRIILRSGGIFSLDDFVGPSRFQWPESQLALANAVREAIPLKYLATPRSPFAYLSKVERPTIEAMIAMDPSEAADSERILPALSEHFPEVVIRKTGGVVYHLALHDVLHNFDADEDKNLLKLLMIIDDQCIAFGETHYAAAIGQKAN